MTGSGKSFLRKYEFPILTAVVPPAAVFRGGDTVHLVDYTDNDGPDSAVILTGAIADFGKAVSVNPDGSVNPEHNS